MNPIPGLFDTPILTPPLPSLLQDREGGSQAPGPRRPLPPGGGAETAVDPPSKSNAPKLTCTDPTTQRKQSTLTPP